MLEEKRETGEPREIVSRYVPGRKEGPEVVSRYTQPGPLPQRLIRPEQTAETQQPVRRRSRRGLWIFLGCLGALVLVVVIALVAVSLDGNRVELPEDGDASSIIDIFHEEKTTIPQTPGDPNAPLQISSEHGPELTAQQLYAEVNPSVVAVVAIEGEGASVGTGVIMTSDGYIITNAHVISGGSSCWIALDTGVTYDALLVGYDAQQDLAVLKAVDAQNLPAAEFGDSDQVRVGDTVYAIGNPLGLELRGTLTNGIISAVNRAVEMDGNSMTLLQTNAALNSGNSGGPLINAYGQVIGINVMKMTGVGDEQEGTVEGLGFALPITDMAAVVDDIMTYGYFRGNPTIGVEVQTVATEDGTAVVVRSVTPLSGARKAGVQVGDIILEANGEKVELTEDLLRVRRTLGVGDTLRLTVQRGDEILSLDVVLQSDRD